MLEGASLLVNVKVPDLDEAVEFYGRLGFTELGRRSLLPGHEDVLLAAGDATVCVERGEGGKLAYETITLEVDDVERTVATLRERGIEPEEYDLPSVKTVDGIAAFGAVQAAWVKDPGGNLVGVMTRARGGRPLAE